jgi:HPt (histidine-containing phosphotransfer) domain-containing protein
MTILQNRLKVSFYLRSSINGYQKRNGLTPFAVEGIALNFKELSKNLGLEEEEYMELLELFVKTGIADLNELWIAVDMANAEKAARIAHSLKGAALNLGLHEFHELAETIGKTARAGQLIKTAQIAKTYHEKLEAVAGLVKR